MTARTPQLERKQAAALAVTEFRRCADLLGTLDDAAFATPTDCPEWDVRQMAAHMLGMVEMAASLREGARQRKIAASRGGTGAGFLDELTALQVSERADRTGAQIAERFATRWPKAAAGRRRAPGFVRRRPMYGGYFNGAEEQWTIGYLLDVILTRDPWTHRMDICRAVGRAPELSADHDGVIVADVVAEWAERHGKDFTLHLTGVAGGTWSVGANGPAIELDAIEFCRVLSGRRGEVGIDTLFATEVPF
jgi:uncharacterized protein (TIGR03083 family)